jgi:iron complex transport system substrate-binding protein
MTLRPRASRLTAPGAALALGAALLAGCSTGSTAADGGTEPESTTSVDADAFPVTLEHAFGETTIEEEPTRVATLGWNDHETALSLGVVPVGATKMTWGGNEAGSSDWFDAALEEAGAEAPVRYDDSDGAPVVEIAKLDPDLILATNSGLTEAEYEKLSKIAPVVAYPDAPWITPWQTSLEMVGEALGRSTLAEEVEAETQARIDAAKAEYPQLEDASLIFAYLTTADLSTIGIYSPEDPRVAFLHDLGMVDAPMVDEAIEDGQFYGTVSAERAADLESDVLITYAETEDEMATYANDPLLGQIPAIESGHAFGLVDKHLGLAVTNPTPLSIPYTLEHFVPEVAEAVDGS